MSLQQARTLVGLNRWAEAKNLLQPVLADPDCGHVPWCLLAQCHLGLGEVGPARKAARRAVAVGPDHEWPHRLLAVVLVAGSRGAPMVASFGEGRQIYRSALRALALAPDQAKTLSLMVDVALMRFRWREAERYAVTNLEANPDSALAWRSAAAVALRRRRWAVAQERARRGLAIAPQDPQLILQLGAALQGLGHTPDAADVYSAAVRADPTDNQGRRALGRLGRRGGPTGWTSFVVRIGAVVVVGNVSTQGYREPASAAVILGVPAAVIFGYQEWRHRRAVAALRPQMRALASKERRRVIRIWLLLAVVPTAVLTGRAAVRHEWVATGVLAFLIAVAAGLGGWVGSGLAPIRWREELGLRRRALVRIRFRPGGQSIR